MIRASYLRAIWFRLVYAELASLVPGKLDVRLFQTSMYLLHKLKSVESLVTQMTQSRRKLGEGRL